MPGRILISFLSALALLVPLRSFAFEARWSNGRADLSFSQARRCTLIVTADPDEEVLPPEWRLIWAAEGAAEPQIQLMTLAADRASAGTCAIDDSVSSPEIGCNVLRVLHCSPADGVRRRTVRYVLDVAPGVVARVAIVPVPPESSYQRAAEVSLNGGAGLSLPPVLYAAERRRSGDDVIVRCSGWNLDQVVAAHYLVRGARPPAMTLVSKTGSTLVARVDLPCLVPVGTIELIDRDGARSAFTLPRDDATAAEQISVSTLVARFRPHRLDLEAGRTGAALDNVIFRTPATRDSLRALGVTRLDRVFPWFSHEDTLSSNGLGEPVRLEDLADVYCVEFSATTSARAA